MKIGVNAINNYLKTKLATEDMVWALEQTEVEVEEILYAKKLDPKVIVTEIVKIEPHPNADRLKLVTVSTDAGQKKLVCGGPNVKVGLKVAFAQAGTILPDGTEIKPTNIRGVDSEGMLCTEFEIGWGEDTSGVIELNPRFPLGKSLCDIVNYGDVLDIKTPSNRWDYLSIIGLAREIAAATQNNTLVEPNVGEYTYQNREVVNVKKTEECRAFYSVKLRVKVPNKSPQWVVDNLQAAGMRSISPVVDITNFVMLEYGQPSHAFDNQKVSGNLQVRLAKAGESLTTLDGKNRKLTANDLVIADYKGPLDIAGVMGGEKTEVGPNTKEIYLTIANFDKTTVRRASLRHGLRTEASNRYEKGLPLPLPHLAAKRLMDLFAEICSSEIIDGPFEQIYAKVENPWLGVRIRKAEKFLGTKIDEKAIIQGLTKRGFSPKHFSLASLTKELMNKPYKKDANVTDDGLEAFDEPYLTQVVLSKAAIRLASSATEQFQSGEKVELNNIKPGDLVFKAEQIGLYIGQNKVLQASRQDKKVVLSPLSTFTKASNFKAAKRYTTSNLNHIISIQIPWWRNDITLEQDLFEEIAKIIGYDNIPASLPELPAMNTQADQTLPRLMEFRRMFVSAGWQEIWTHSFVSKKDLELTNNDKNQHLQIENPLSSEQDYLRSNLLASHLRVVGSNQANHNQAQIFEVSRVYKKAEKSALENWQLGLTAWGKNSTLRIKAGIDLLFGINNLKFTIARVEIDNFVKGRVGEICLGKEPIGYYGQISLPTTSSFKLKYETSFCSLDLNKLFEKPTEVKILAPLPYQAVERDLTIELNEITLWQDIKAILEKQPQLINLEFMNEFKNPQLANKNLKRLSFRLTFDLGPTPKQSEIETNIQNSVKLLSNFKGLGKITII